MSSGRIWNDAREQRQLQEVRRQLDEIKLMAPDRYADARDSIAFQLWCQFLYAGPAKTILRGALITLLNAPRTFLQVTWMAVRFYLGLCASSIPVARRYPKNFIRRLLAEVHKYRQEHSVPWSL